jgi:hypothetical protein
MDRRNFVKMMLATPILTSLILSSKRTKNDLELFLIAEEPHLFIHPLLEETLKYSSSESRTFGFLNPHPGKKGLKEVLLKKSWRFIQEPALANLTFSFSHLQHKASPSFTLVKEGRIWDIRSQKLYTHWRKMNNNRKPSSFLTIASLKNSPADHLGGEFVSVYSNGRKVEILSLKEKTTQTFRAQDGKVTARIEDGKAWVSESSCRHKICLYSPPVSLAGERIVCAPNHFLLEIQRSSSIDTIIG